MLHKKYVGDSKLHQTATFKGINIFHMDLLNYLGNSIPIKFDFKLSLQIHECDYKKINKTVISVKLCISKK